MAARTYCTERPISDAGFQKHCVEDRIPAPHFWTIIHVTTVRGGGSTWREGGHSTQDTTAATTAANSNGGTGGQRTGPGGQRTGPIGNCNHATPSAPCMPPPQQASHQNRTRDASGTTFPRTSRPIQRRRGHGGHHPPPAPQRAPSTWNRGRSWEECRPPLTPTAPGHHSRQSNHAPRAQSAQTGGDGTPATAAAATTGGRGPPSGGRGCNGSGMT